MLRSLNEIIGYKILGKDGVVGKCKDFLFDDSDWSLRFIDIDTGTWLPSRRVLVSHRSLQAPVWKSKTIPVDLTKKQIENSPPLSSNAPVSKQWEQKYYSHFGWPYYGLHDYIGKPFTKNLSDPPTRTERAKKQLLNEHLRSFQEVQGYSIQAQDDHFGSLKDLAFDDESWKIRYLLVDTVKWIPSKTVLLSPDWVSEIDWLDSRIHAELTKEQIKSAPNFDESAPINKEYEVRLYDYYGRPKYWENRTIGS